MVCVRSGPRDVSWVLERDAVVVNHCVGRTWNCCRSEGSPVGAEWETLLCFVPGSWETDGSGPLGGSFGLNGGVAIGGIFWGWVRRSLTKDGCPA